MQPRRAEKAEPSTHPWLGTPLGLSVLSQGAWRLQSGDARVGIPSPGLWSKCWAWGAARGGGHGEQGVV